MALFILEIGSEEIPARFLHNAETTLADLMEKALADNKLAFENIKTFSTPRRLILQVTGLAPVQAVTEEVITGPPVKIAFNVDGTPSKALAGFVSGNGITVEDTFKIITPKGDYIACRKQSGGKPAQEILREVLPGILKNITFPKSMHWGENKIIYARPIKWILALYDKEIVPFTLGPIKAGRLTWGHRIHASSPITVSAADEVLDKLDTEGKIIIDAETRAAEITTKGDALAHQLGGKIIWKDGLLNEVSGLVEHPNPIIGDFDPSYLSIPEEVLLTSMETHQKSFGIKDEHGKLLPHFLTVLNLEPEDPALVKHGWERVLKARLEDARFFWETDLGVSLDDWLNKLDKVIFIGPLGSMGDKSRRLEALCGWLANKMTPPINDLAAKMAGKYAKADLVSGMVGEFDTLQGIMGGIYARHAGFEDNVAKAIMEQYLPAGPDSPLPQTPLGAVLAIADKTDTLTGCFGLGRIPTGMADPEGLRRCALGIIRIMLGYDIAIPLNNLFEESLKLYSKISFPVGHTEIMESLHNFLKGRLRHYFINLDYPTILVDAVLASGFENLPDTKMRLDALYAFSKKSGYEKSAQILKRIDNISKKDNIENMEWNAALFQEEAEASLASELERVLPKLDRQLEEQAYDKALEMLEALQGPVDNFFDNVMVLCEDANLRANRLRMIASINNRYKKIAAFSLLQI